MVSCRGLASVSPCVSSLSSMHRLGASLDHITAANTVEQKFEIVDTPAPGKPFHHAFPIHDFDAARDFYNNVMGCKEGRVSPGKWIDFSLSGHQIVCHWVGSDYRCPDFHNPVDGDEVPVPHFGLALDWDSWQSLRQRLEVAGTNFIVQPTLRFKGAPGEQWTMFFKDPSGNNLEFKTMSKPENLFAKYDVITSSTVPPR